MLVSTVALCASRELHATVFSVHTFWEMTKHSSGISKEFLKNNNPKRWFIMNSFHGQISLGEFLPKSLLIEVSNIIWKFWEVLQERNLFNVIQPSSSWTYSTTGFPCLLKTWFVKHHPREYKGYMSPHRSSRKLGRSLVGNRPITKEEGYSSERATEWDKGQREINGRQHSQEGKRCQAWMGQPCRLSKPSRHLPSVVLCPFKATSFNHQEPN